MVASHRAGERNAMSPSAACAMRHDRVRDATHLTWLNADLQRARARRNKQHKTTDSQKKNEGRRTPLAVGFNSCLPDKWIFESHSHLHGQSRRVSCQIIIVQEF